MAGEIVLVSGRAEAKAGDKAAAKTKADRSGGEGRAGGNVVGGTEKAGPAAK